MLVGRIRFPDGRGVGARGPKSPPADELSINDGRNSRIDAAVLAVTLNESEGLPKLGRPRNSVCVNLARFLVNHSSMFCSSIVISTCVCRFEFLDEGRDPS